MRDRTNSRAKSELAFRGVFLDVRTYIISVPILTSCSVRLVLLPQKKILPIIFQILCNILLLEFFALLIHSNAPSFIDTLHIFYLILPLHIVMNLIISLLTYIYEFSINLESLFWLVDSLFCIIHLTP